MGFSLAVAGLFLFFCISPGIRASFVVKMDGPESDVEEDAPREYFTVGITEKGARFNEKISIDKEMDIEYFKVPAHNDLQESDNLYDFRMNITVSRVKKDRVCQITPLPSDLPRPDVLSEGLKAASKSPPSHNVEKIIQQWRVGDKVDKSTLRQEVRDFCGEFPVYRLVPFTLDSVSVVSEDEPDIRAGRTRRNIDFPLCDNSIPPCNPSQWTYSCKISTSRCVYYVACELDKQQNILSCATETRHMFTSLVCCTPKCP